MGPIVVQKREKALSRRVERRRLEGLKLRRAERVDRARSGMSS